jgi:hypothetical protein
VYPLYNEALGLTSEVELEAEAFFRDHAPHYSGPFSVFTHAQAKFYNLALEGTLLVLLAMVLIPLVLCAYVVSGDPPGSQAGGGCRFLYVTLILLVVFVILSWTVGTGNRDGRFMMPSYSVLCLVLAAGYGYVARQFSKPVSRRGLNDVLPLLLSLLMLASYVYRVRFTYEDLNESLWPVLGEQRQEEYLAKRFAHMDVIRFIERELPEDALILGVGYPLKRPHIAFVKHGVHPIETVLGKDYSAEQLSMVMQEQGITHLVYPGDVRLAGQAIEHLEDGSFRAVFRGGSRTLYEVLPSQ